MNAHLARRAFAGRRILVCVCGGIAAYKLAETVSQLVQAGADVRVAMTPEATRFISPLTFEALSGRPVASDLFGQQAQSGLSGGEAHITLSDWPEAIVAAPATANLIAKLAHGLADEVVSTTILASGAALVLAPAMHQRMWEAEATAVNVSRLGERGVIFAGPVEGRLASGESGIGRLADQEDILRALHAALPGGRDLAGTRVVVTAGATREAIDPVRFIGNRSSGLMGHSVAAAAEARGAEVTLITGASLPEPRGVRVRHIESAAELLTELEPALAGADVLIMAAAVADVRPRRAHSVKLKKAEMPAALELETNPDILATLADKPGSRDVLRVGFAAETHDVEEHAREKLLSKSLDIVVANDVSQKGVGMGAADNAVTILTRDGRRVEVPRAPKEEVAEQILDAVVQLRAAPLTAPVS